MVDASTDFYKYVDNFAKFAHVGWRCVCGDEGLLEKVFVTISIPTYNRPDTLKDAIDSALNQEGYDDYCVMVVDNDPTDGTATEELIKSYHSDKLVYIKNDENTGMFGNQNRCFEIPKSEYVLMLHDDDIIAPRYLTECFPILKDKDIDGLQPASIKWNANAMPLKSMAFHYSSKGVLKRYCDLDNYWSFKTGSQTGGIYRRSVILAVGGYNSDYYPTSDYCLGVQLMEKYRIYTYSLQLILYRVGENASMKQETLELFIYNDHFLRHQILRKIGIPDFFSKLLLSYCAYTQYEGLKSMFNNQLTFDFSKINVNFRCPYALMVPLRLFTMGMLFLKKTCRYKDYMA